MEETEIKQNKLKDLLGQFKELMEIKKEKKYSIKNIELFKKAVAIDGRDFRDYDLSVIIDNYKKLKRKGFKIKLVFGHDEYTERERLGYVTNLKVNGDSLYGDFVDLKEEIYTKFKEDIYNGWSIEFFNNVNDENGKNIGTALMRVAVLSSNVAGFPFLESNDLQYDFSKASLVCCYHDKKLIEKEVVKMESLTLEKHNFEIEKLTSKFEKDKEETKTQMEKEVLAYKEKIELKIKGLEKEVLTYKAKEKENNINLAFEDWAKMQILKESDRDNFKVLFTDDKYTKLDVLKQLANVVKTNVQARQGDFDMFTQEITKNDNDLFVSNIESEVSDDKEYEDKVIAEMKASGELSEDFVKKF